MNKKTFFCFLLGIFLFAGMGIGKQREAESFLPGAFSFQPISNQVDWRPQDYWDIQGIIAVRFDPEGNCLILTADFKKGDANKSKGEVELDLKYTPGVERNVPIDMSNTVIIVQLEIPPEFIADPSAPNGGRLYVKYVNEIGQWIMMEGNWINIETSGLVTFSMTIPPNSNKIRIIGIKFSTNLTDSSGFQYRGEGIKVKNIVITPNLPYNQPPDLPPDQPLPWVTGDAKVDLRTGGFYIGSQKWFAAGGNWRLIEYRQNFGSTAWFPKGYGVSIRPNYVKTRLDWYRRAGITVIRVGLLDDGTTMFDKNGNVTGYNQVFRNDVSTFLYLANEFNMKVEFELIDYLIAGKGKDSRGVWLRGRRKVIEDPLKRQEFIDNFLEPFLNDFGNHPVILGFDVLNEPEWLISTTEGGDWENVLESDDKCNPAITRTAFENFVYDCTKKIHTLAPEKFVTNGVTCPFTDLQKNLDLDYIAIHHYAEMGPLENNIPPPDHINKPWSLEEFSGSGNLFDYLKTTVELVNENSTGAQVWNLSPGIDYHSYTFAEEEGKLKEFRKFVDSLNVFLTVIAPNGGEKWNCGTIHNIIWSSTGTIANIKIELSTNNGSSWSNVIAATANDGIHAWIVPNTPSSQCLVRISDVANAAIKDASNAVFTIVPVPTLTVTSPNGGENWLVGVAHNITWNSTGSIANVKIEYSTNDGSIWSNIVAATANDGSHVWIVPNTPSRQCLVRICDTANANVKDTSNAVFTINAPPQVAIVSPEKNTSLYGVATVKANASDDTGVVRVEFYVDGVLKGQAESRQHPLSLKPVGNPQVLKKTVQHSVDPNLEVKIIGGNSQYTFTWNTMEASPGAHVLRVVAYDGAGAMGFAEVSVQVIKVKLELQAERREVRAFSILRYYGWIQFTVDTANIPVAQYRLMRRQGSGDFVLLSTVVPAQLQNNQFEMQDKYLEKDIHYTYRVEAYDTAQQMVGISLEKTI